MITLVETRDHALIASMNEEVQNLHADLHPELFKRYDKPAMEAAIEKFFSDPACFCYLALLNNTPAGYMICMIRENPENAFHYTSRTLYIDQIAVLEKYRKCGAGRLLLEQALTIARTKGLNGVELDHWSNNTIASAFFRKNGFGSYKERLYQSVRL